MYVDIPDNDRLFWSCDEAESQLLISSQINDARLWNVFGIDREPLSRIFIGCRFIQMAAIKTGKSFRKSWQFPCHTILFKWEQWNTKRANKKQIIEGTIQQVRIELLWAIHNIHDWNKNIFCRYKNPKKTFIQGSLNSQSLYLLKMNFEGQALWNKPVQTLASLI